MIRRDPDNSPLLPLCACAGIICIGALFALISEIFG